MVHAGGQADVAEDIRMAEGLKAAAVDEAHGPHAAGQGILAIQGRKGEDTSFLKEWNDEEGTLCALAERAFIRELDGGCSSPIAAYAKIEDGSLILSGLYYKEEDQKIRKGCLTGNVEEAEEIGKNLAKQLKEKF